MPGYPWWAQGYGASTAIARSSPSLPVTELFARVPFSLNERILDYGAGRGADVRWIQSMGYQVDGYDPEHQVAAPAPHGRYRLVILSYVLNTIPTVAGRREAIRNAYGYTARCGILYVTTRTRSEVDREARTRGWTRSGDGWRTKSGTFQRGYDAEELWQFVQSTTKTPCLHTFPDSRFSRVLAVRPS